MEPIQRLITAATRYAQRLNNEAPKGATSTVAEMWRLLAVDAQVALDALRVPEKKPDADFAGDIIWGCMFDRKLTFDEIQSVALAAANAAINLQAERLEGQQPAAPVDEATKAQQIQTCLSWHQRVTRDS